MSCGHINQVDPLFSHKDHLLSRAIGRTVCSRHGRMTKEQPNDISFGKEIQMIELHQKKEIFLMPNFYVLLIRCLLQITTHGRINGHDFKGTDIPLCLQYLLKPNRFNYEIGFCIYKISPKFSLFQIDLGLRVLVRQIRENRDLYI